MANLPLFDQFYAGLRRVHYTSSFPFEFSSNLGRGWAIRDGQRHGRCYTCQMQGGVFGVSK